MAITLPRRQHIPDILDCLAQLSNDEVPTPPKLARAMLDLLPAEVWSNPDYKWLDPSCKSGAILREVATRLLKGLAEWEPDWTKRREHIFKHMLFGTAVTEMTGIISRRSVYCSRDVSGPHSVVRFDDAAGNLPFIATEHAFKHGRCTVCGAPEGLERGASRENYAYAFIHGSYPTEEMQDMKFDVIVGNPPYQIGTTDASGDRATNVLPLYQLFVEKAIELDPRYLVMITPSRWFTGGKGLDEFRDRMIADRRLRVLVDNPKIFDCFPGVKIRGGVSYFRWDRDRSGDCSVSTRIGGTVLSTSVRDLREGDGVLIRDNRAASIIQKVKSKSHECLADVVSPRDPFGQTVQANTPSKQRSFKGSVPLIYATKVGFIRASQLDRNQDWVDHWKVLLPKASSGDTPVDNDGHIVDVVLGAPIALAPGSACTYTYLVAGMFDTREETENYAYYLATKFVRFLVLQRKTTQNGTREMFRFVPMLDMTRRWTDEDLYKKFKLTTDERDYIEKSIKPRSVNLSLDSPIPASHLPGGSKYRAD
ncbi:MAG TPA: Eco57I restriction-modification methylase domain-containing protein [Rhodanobacteraceae bacterium]|nr:Eco57I restriction-modification methylase domain-containing protein [Rhodanobacteraceae bacterium]